MSNKMQETRAVVFDKYGADLRVGTLKLRKLAPNEILMKVYAASINHIDSGRQIGRMKSYVHDTFPTGIGYDGAGTVEAIGSNITRFAIGDRIVASTTLQDPATLAEFCVVGDDQTFKIPDNVSFIDAAGLPLAGQTALQGLQRGGLKEGQSVFISGGSGGVGSYAIQIAKTLLKAGRVVTTCSTSKVDFCKSLGADEVLDYTKCDPYSTVVGPFDMILDLVGDVRKMGGPLIKPGGYVVSVATGLIPEPGTFDRNNVPISFLTRTMLYLGSLPLKWAVSPGIYNWVFATVSKEGMIMLVEAIGEGKIKTYTDSVFEGLEKTPDAFARLATKRAAGKIVIVVRT